NRVAQLDSPAGSMIYEFLHFSQFWFRRFRVFVFASNRSNYAAALRSKWKNPYDSVLRQEQMNMDPVQRTFDSHVCKKKCLRVRLAFERKIQGMPHSTVGPITAYEPFRFHKPFAPVGAAADGRTDAIPSLREADQFPFSLHTNPML